MVKPIVNLYIKGGNYRKTILFDVDNLSLILEDTEKVEGASDVIFNFEILQPLNHDELKKFRYDGGNYEVEVYVPIFDDSTEYHRDEYIFGKPTQSMEYVKYPVFNGKDAYTVTEIFYGAFAGTDNTGDVIHIYVNFFSNFIESEIVENFMEDRTTARQNIPTVTSNANIDKMINKINDERASAGFRPLEYRYHIYEGKSILLDLNLEDIMMNPLTYEKKTQTINLSMFDMLSTHMNWELMYQKKNLLHYQKSEKTVQIVMTKNQERFLKEIHNVSDSTWKKYQRLGIFKFV